MKKTYLARRNALLSARSVSWGAGALLFSLLALGLRLVAPNAFWQILTPVFQVSDAVAGAHRSFFSSFGTAARLAEMNERLMGENTALSIQNRTLAQQLADQESLGGGSAMMLPGIVAGVIARPPTSPYDTLVLGKGSESGVTLGMEAFGPGGVPIGVISSVLKDFSQVTLFSTPGVATAGWVGQHSLPLTLVGAGGGAFRASMPRAANVAVGDVVSVPGPGRLSLGSVVRVDSDSLSPAVTLRIVSASNPFSITMVELRNTGITGMSFASSTLP